MTNIGSYLENISKMEMSADNEVIEGLLFEELEQRQSLVANPDCGCSCSCDCTSCSCIIRF